MRFLPDVNLYTYVGNMPTFYTDPLGSAKFPPMPYPGDPVSNCMAVLIKWAMKALLKQTQGMHDKYVHCITGCEVARACGKDINEEAAWTKEMLDTGLGTPDSKDAFATDAVLAEIERRAAHMAFLRLVRLLALVAFVACTPDVEQMERELRCGIDRASVERIAKDDGYSDCTVSADRATAGD